jgi:hypothetical protein
MADNPEVDDPFLAWIDNRMAALQRFRESYLALGPGGLGSADVPLPVASAAVGVTAAAVGAQPVSLPTGIFRDKGLTDAIRLYLSVGKRKQTIREIHDALLAGGLATTSSTFMQTLSGTLYRMKRIGELLLFPDGWDLAASYPESFRQRLAQSEESAAKAKRPTTPKKNKKGPKVKATKAAKPGEAPSAAPKQTTAA